MRTYSGGMRRRLDIAASLVQRPPVLFLDEPTTGLDLNSRNELWDMIRELVSEGTTVLLTTQYLEEADRLADRIAVVDGGQVIANDTPERAQGAARQHGDRDGHGRRRRRRARGRAARRLIEGRVGARGDTVRITRTDGAHVLIEALRALDGAGLAPDTLAVREPSMDDVFLALTGHAAEGARADEPARRPSRGKGGSRMSSAADRPPPATDRARPRGSRSARVRDTLGHRPAQPDRLPPRAAAAGVLHDPAGDLRADVPYVFGGAIVCRPAMPYVDYLMPGMFMQTVVFGSIATAIGLATDLKSGLLERFRSLPMARSAVLTGRTLGGPRCATCSSWS